MDEERGSEIVSNCCNVIHDFCLVEATARPTSWAEAANGHMHGIDFARIRPKSALVNHAARTERESTKSLLSILRQELGVAKHRESHTLKSLLDKGMASHGGDSPGRIFAPFAGVRQGAPGSEFENVSG
jgi:hypothetical protein